MTRGRKPNTSPATAYDYHRALLLVQVLSQWADDYNALDKALGTLCNGWGVDPALRNPGYGWVTLDRLGTIRALARAALEHGREG